MTAPRVLRVSASLVMVLAIAALAELGMQSALAHESPTTSVGRVLAALTLYAGVCALVALSLTVATGVIATDRVLLSVRQRIWAQSAHRTLSLLAVSFLGLHVLTEIASGRAGVVAALVPFVAASAYVGLGTVAAYLLGLVAWTGLIRARFAGGGRPWLWRVLHTIAYLCWPVSLLHGLLGGRSPALWVTASYLLLVLAVLIAVVVRLLGEYARRAGSRPAGDARTTRSIGVFDQRHPARGRAAVPRPLHSEIAELPTLVDLRTARGLRRGSTEAAHWAAIRGEAR